MGTNMISAAVLGAIILVVSFVLWPILNSASDNLYLYFVESCEKDSERYVKAYKSATDGAINTYNPTTGRYFGTGIAITASGGDCSFTSVAAASDKFYNERGKVIHTNDGTAVTTAAATAASGEWKALPGLMKRFGTLNHLLTSLIPVISIAGMMSISGAGLIDYAKGSGNISSAIKGSVLTLVLTLVMLFLAPIVLDSVIGAGDVGTSGQYQINSRFGSIISLLFSVIPLLYVAGLLSLYGFQAWNRFGKGSGAGDMLNNTGSG